MAIASTQAKFCSLIDTVVVSVDPERKKRTISRCAINACHRFISSICIHFVVNSTAPGIRARTCDLQTFKRISKTSFINGGSLVEIFLSDKFHDGWISFFVRNFDISIVIRIVSSQNTNAICCWSNSNGNKFLKNKHFTGRKQISDVFTLTNSSTALAMLGSSKCWIAKDSVRTKYRARWDIFFRPSCVCTVTYFGVCSSAITSFTMIWALCPSRWW